MVQVRLAQVDDAPELKKLNDLFNGKDSATLETIKKSLDENNPEIVCVAAWKRQFADTRVIPFAWIY